jgi:serine protease inhibitor
VNEATKGNIDSVVEEDQLDELTRLILINAIYFKGEFIAEIRLKRSLI